MRFPHGETVTIIRRPARDRTGDPESGANVSHTIEKCGIAWSSGSSAPGSTENTDRRETVESTVTLYCPAGSDIVATDLVELPDGDQYRVVGKPARWKSPFTGWEPGVVVSLKAVI